MSYSTRQRMWYNHHRDTVCENLGITKNQYNMFRRIGEALHSVYEDQCNGVNEDTTEEQEAALMKKGCDIAYKLNLDIYFQTDPRGATIYVDTKPIPYNDYTRANCIY